MEKKTMIDFDTHRIVIFSGVVIFTFIGLYGNISLIVAHIRVSKLRSKYGLLLSLLSFCQSLCLVYEWIGGIYIIVTHDRSIRSSCFKLIAGYVYLHCMQTGLMATIAVDLFITIAFPLWHRVTRNDVYVAIIAVPSILYGLLTVIFGFIMMDDGTISMCNPPSSLHESVKIYWYIVAFIAGGITIFCYILSYLTIRYYSKLHLDQPQEIARRTMRNMSIIVLIFLFTRYLATVGANILNLAHVDPNIVEFFQNYCAFAAMICYSQNFYVTFWRSSEYREVLWKQQVKLHNFFCGAWCPLSLEMQVFSDSHRITDVHVEHISMKINHHQ